MLPCTVGAREAIGPVLETYVGDRRIRRGADSGFIEDLARVGGACYKRFDAPSQPFSNRRLITLDGTPARCPGLAAGPKHVPRCVQRVSAGGINYFFFHGPGNTSF